MRFHNSSWIVGLSAWISSACSATLAAPPSAPPPPQVSVAEPILRKVQDWYDFTGRLEAVNSVELRPRVSGHIQAVRFVEGSKIKKDQVLFLIDARPFREEVNRLQAELRRNESQVTLAHSNLERGERLLKEGATSTGELDQLRAASAGAVASLDSIRASLASAQLNLEFTNVRAPIDGRVSNALITAGNLVSNADLLTRIVSDDPIYMYFDMDEASFLALADPYQAEVQMGLSSDDGYPHHGKLNFVNNRVDPNSGTIRARAVFGNADQRLTPGLFTRVRLLTGTQFDAVLIDEKALLTDQNRKYVFVLDATDHAQRKDVQLGRALGGLRIVTKGLAASDRVIVQGTQKVFAPGMPVKAEAVAMIAPDQEVKSGTD